MDQLDIKNTLELVLQFLSVLSVVAGALWGLFIYVDKQQRENEAQRKADARDQITRRIEAQRPMLQKQLELYFETARLAGKLAIASPRSDEWKGFEGRFWELYWSELSMVEHRVVEAAMVKLGNILPKYKSSPDDETLHAEVQRAIYDLAHAIRQGIEETWGTPTASLFEN